MTCRSLTWRTLFCLVVLCTPAQMARAGTSPLHRVHANIDLTGTVTDSTTGGPLQSAEIAVTRMTGGVVSNTITDAFGHFTVHNLAPGSYTVSVHFLGFRPLTRPLTIGESATAAAQMSFAMTPIGLNLAAVEVTATAPISVDTRTGDQVFKQNDYHGAPTNTTSQILQQSIVGAARAPTGEVHIRGQHAEYTYYIDGVPVPPGISGSLNELFDPQVVNQINFQTGGWDAEHGGRNAAVVNVTTKIPAGGFHGSLSSYAGTYDGSTTLGAKGYNGQSGSVSGGLLFLRRSAILRYAARACRDKRRCDEGNESPQRRHRLLRLRQDSIHAERERRAVARGEFLADAIRCAVRLHRRCVPE
jgi:hypothetical protein